MDYIFRWLHLRFGDQVKEAAHPGILASAHDLVPSQPASQTAPHRDSEDAVTSSDAPSCKHCGSITTRNGSCYVCVNCGSSSGCS
jgi:ribonucleoside-diphosphate reductase alpha chain